jgi:hypothetical protein
LDHRIIYHRRQDRGGNRPDLTRSPHRYHVGNQLVPLTIMISNLYIFNSQNKLHSYLSNWNLLTSRTNTDLDDWILVPSADQLFSIQEHHSHKVDNDIPYESVAYSESIRESYKRRSLAAKTNTATIPDSYTSHFLIPDSTSKKARAHKPSAPFTFSLPSSPHHKSSSVQDLEDVPDRPSSLEVYELEHQNHERLAVELESTAEVWKRIRGERYARTCSRSRCRRPITMRNRRIGRK